jgi:hypothetical protein
MNGVLIGGKVLPVERAQLSSWQHVAACVSEPFPSSLPALEKTT